MTAPLVVEGWTLTWEPAAGLRPAFAVARSGSDYAALNDGGLRATPQWGSRPVPRAVIEAMFAMMDEHAEDER